MRVNVGAFICKSDLFNCIYLHSHISTARFDRERACLALRRTLRIRLVCCTRIHFSIHFAVEWPIKVPLESHMCSPSHYLCSQPSPLYSPLCPYFFLCRPLLALLSSPVLSCPVLAQVALHLKPKATEAINAVACASGKCHAQLPQAYAHHLSAVQKQFKVFFPSLFIFAVNKFETLC